MSAPNDPEHGVVRELMAGHNLEENFRRLYHRYYSAVHNYLARKGLSPEDCHDLTQEVFVAVYLGVGKLRSESAFLSWLFSIARHLWLRSIENRPREPAAAAHGKVAGSGVDPIDTAASADPDPLRLMLDQEKVTAVRAAIEDLPDRVRDCLRARVVDRLTYREIGQRLGISENTVAVHVHRGVKNLRARLKLFRGGAPAAGGLLDEPK